jgi:hypothetical protein
MIHTPINVAEKNFLQLKNIIPGNNHTNINLETSAGVLPVAQKTTDILSSVPISSPAVLNS